MRFVMLTFPRLFALFSFTRNRCEWRESYARLGFSCLIESLRSFYWTKCQKIRSIFHCGSHLYFAFVRPPEIAITAWLFRFLDQTSRHFFFYNKRKIQRTSTLFHSSRKKSARNLFSIIKKKNPNLVHKCCERLWWVRCNAIV